MTEASGSSTPPTAATSEVAAPPPWHESTNHRPSRLYLVLAWIGIVCGVLFIVAVVFFSGVFLGRATGGHDHWHHDYRGGQMGSGADDPIDVCPMTRPNGTGPGATMGPGQWSPGGMMGPQQSPSTAAPTMPRP